jgi:microcystin-dependent protein
MNILKRNVSVLSSLVLTIFFNFAATSVALADISYTAEIRQFPYTFCPIGWQETDGALILIAQNTALFSLIGTTYGGDGINNFALPNIQARVAKHVGNGPGLGLATLGQSGGNDTFKLTKLPTHTHSATTTTTTLHASSDDGNVSSPSGAYFADDGTDRIYSQVSSDVSLSEAAATSDTALSSTGNADPTPINRRQPYLSMSYCISMNGIFPPRD